MKEQYKSGFVALIGRPNVGKSTLMNHLIGQKIAITSRKPQTTRNRIQTVYTSERGQIVFLDTPGIHKAKNKLGEYMVTAAESTLRGCGRGPVAGGTGKLYRRGREQHIAQVLGRCGKPVVLVINKIDRAEKEKLPEYAEAYRKLYPFEEILMVSALRGLHLNQILDVLYRLLPEGPQFFDEDTVTDQPLRQIAAELIREKALQVPGG